MTDDQSFDENEESTLDEERESEEAPAPVTREEFERLEKGIQKLATDVGREKKQPEQDKPKDEPTVVEVTNPVIKNLYFKANPEAPEIWDEVTNEAKKLGKDPFELYEGSAYFKGEAKARAEAKAEEEKSKSKVNKPSSEVDFSKNIASVKEEDIDSLTPKQKVEWIRAQAAKERANTD
jgi:hypothetical protein